MPQNVKKTALKLIQGLPEDVSIEDIMYELYFRQRVDRGLQELSDGKIVSHEEVKQSVMQWLQSTGR